MKNTFFYSQIVFYFFCYCTQPYLITKKKKINSGRQSDFSYQRNGDSSA